MRAFSWIFPWIKRAASLHGESEMALRAMGVGGNRVPFDGVLAGREFAGDLDHHRLVVTRREARVANRYSAVRTRQRQAGELWLDPFREMDADLRGRGDCAADRRRRALQRSVGEGAGTAKRQAASEKEN